MKTIFLQCVIAVVLIITGCTPQVNTEAEKAKVKEVVDQFAQAWETNDMELFSRIIAHDADMVNFGTDEAEHFVGWTPLKDAAEQMFSAFENVRIAVSDQTIKVHPSGTVAWFSQLWDWDLLAMGEPIQVHGARFTGVLEKRNGGWVFVQFHNSMPVQGQVAEY